MSTDIFKANCSSIISVANNINSKKSIVNNAYAIVSGLDLNDNYSLSLSASSLKKDLKTLSDKMAIIASQTKSFVSSIDSYEDVKDNEDFTIKATNSVTTVSTTETVSISAQSSNSETNSSYLKKITIQKGDTFWNLAIKNGYKGTQWQEIFRDANGNVITEEAAKRYKVGDVIYLVGTESERKSTSSGETTQNVDKAVTTKDEINKSKNTYTDTSELKEYVAKNNSSIINTRSCMVYARERANLYYRDNYGTTFGESRGITYAKDFDNTYKNLPGYTVSNEASVGSIMIFEANSNGAYSSGHAAFVENVSSDGKTIIISETNWSGSGIQTRTINDADTLTNVSYVSKNV